MYTEEGANDIYDDNADVQDGVIATINSDLPDATGDGQEDSSTNGFVMNGFTTEFAMYCGLTGDDDDKNATTDNGTDESSAPHNSDHVEANCEPNGRYDSLRESLLSWNGLHKRSANRNVNIASTETISCPQNEPLDCSNIDTDEDDDGLKASLAWSKLHQRTTPQDYQHVIPPLKVKYMLDYTLNRFTR